jgi:hypothetical protein
MSNEQITALREKVLLRETNAHIVDDKEAAACYRFTLRQIERVEACGSCEATGNRSGWQDAETGLPVPCLWCKRLRADLLELQKEVIG